MNKKFSTLMASLLLAGGVFSTANASDWTTDGTYVQNTGKYFVIEKTGDWTQASAWRDANGFFLTIKNKIPVLTNSSREKGETDYWTIKRRLNTTTGVYEFQLVNANGKVLSYEHVVSPTETITVDWFLCGHDVNLSGGDVNALSFKVGSDIYYLTYGTPDADGDYPFIAKKDQADGFNNANIGNKAIMAKDLNAQMQSGFYLQFGKSGKNEYEEYQNWATSKAGFANVFAGQLTAVGTANDDSKTFYLKSGDQYIVLTDELWGGTSSDLNGTDAYKGYTFELISEHAFANLTNKNNATFKIEKTYDFDQAYGDSLIVTIPKANVGTMGGDKNVRLFVADVNNQSYLTIIASNKANDRLSTNAVIKKNSLELPYIRFGATNIVDFNKFAGKIWNITNVDNGSLSPDANDDTEFDDFLSEFDPKGEVMLNAPEGQWLPYKKGSEYGFVNRESGIKWDLSKTENGNQWVIREAGTNKYTVWSSKYDKANDATKLKYTINITANEAEPGKTETGYKGYTDAVTALNGHYITLTNGVTGNTMYISKNADDEVILTEDQTQAIEFRVKELKHDYTSHDGLAGVDTLQHYTSYLGLNEKGKVVNNMQDTVQFYHYRLFEHFSEKYLHYDSKAHKFVLAKATAPENAHDDFTGAVMNGTNQSICAFVLKEKTDGTFNLISNFEVDYPVCDEDHTLLHPTSEDEYTFDNYFAANLYEGYHEYDKTATSLGLKMEGNIGKAIVDNTANIYTHTNEDRFALVDIETPEYMTITGSQDTVKISLQAKPNFFLYEQGKNGTNFLGMDHVADVEDMKAAILADTAYVRYNTYKPQYLLAVGTDIVKPIYDNAGHMLEPDTVYGRFLVNMVDSAKTYGLDKKSNPYIWEELNGNPYYRLAFVDGYHTGDALTLNTAKAKTKIALNNNNDKVCTFAFRYVDESREGVKIETAYGPADANGNRSRGWLKYQNNVPVVTPDYEDAHVFTVDNTTTDAPTANETIAAGNVVVAGVNGTVVVKGAEGKNVIVSTILGKVVANEVLTSDNAQISAPAGIVVVSVDGESFKVVVK